MHLLKKLPHKLALANKSQPLIAVVGPTAVGKTALALSLAERLHAEIVCADSVTLYREMDIGAAKPTDEEQRRVRHHLLDIYPPDHKISVTEYVDEARESLQDIWSRQKAAIVVGGSGLYVDALLYGYEFSDRVSSDERVAEVEHMSLTGLQSIVEQRYPGIMNESDRMNRRRLIQVLQRGPARSTDRDNRAYDVTILGLDRPDDVLKTSISQRTEAMLSSGLVDEVRGIMKRYGADAPSLNSVGYKQVVAHVGGTILIDELADEINRATWQLVRKQRTWFRRSADIVWIKDFDEAAKVLSKSGYNI